jgi:hypothetical protein
MFHLRIGSYFGRNPKYLRVREVSACESDRLAMEDSIIFNNY